MTDDLTINKDCRKWITISDNLIVYTSTYTNSL